MPSPQWGHRTSRRFDGLDAPWLPYGPRNQRQSVGGVPQTPTGQPPPRQTPASAPASAPPSRQSAFDAHARRASGQSLAQYASSSNTQHLVLSGHGLFALQRAAKPGQELFAQLPLFLLMMQHTAVVLGGPPVTPHAPALL